MEHGNKGNGKKMDVFQMLILNSSARYFIVALFIILSIFCNITCNAYKNIPDSFYSTYAVEEDALQLYGEILKILPWAKQDYKKNNSHFFEPVLLKIRVLTNANGCMGKSFKFMVRRGLNVMQLEKGKIVSFSINRNSCSEDNTLIILNIDGLSREKRR